MFDLKEIAARKIDGLLLTHGAVGVVLTVAERDALVAALRGLARTAALMQAGYCDEDRLMRVLAAQGIVDTEAK